MSDGRIDGQFIIKKGGITQGIAQELGLSSDECKQISGSIWSQVINEFSDEQNMNVKNNSGNTPNSNNNYLVHENAVITFSKDCWNRIVSLINTALGKNIQVESLEEAPTTQAVSDTENPTNEKTQRKQAHERVVQSAIEKLKANWELSGLGEHFKTPEDKALFLQCLNEIEYDTEKCGAGRSEKGIVYIETNNTELKSEAEMLKLLIHEANHAFLQRKAIANNTLNYPTKAEEIECETLALRATSNLINANIDGMSDFEIHGHNVSEYALMEDIEAVSSFQTWVEGYNQYADNLNGDLTIQRHPQTNTAPAGTIQLGDDDCIILGGISYNIVDGKLVEGTNQGQKLELTSNSTIQFKGKIYEISVADKTIMPKEYPKLLVQGGDILTIEGYSPITIGSDAMLEGINNTCITQLIIHHKDFSTPEILGSMVFDDMQPNAQELNMANNPDLTTGRVRFTITKADGSKLEGWCCPSNELSRL